MGRKKKINRGNSTDKHDTRKKAQNDAYEAITAHSKGSNIDNKINLKALEEDAIYNALIQSIKNLKMDDILGELDTIELQSIAFSLSAVRDIERELRETGIVVTEQTYTGVSRQASKLLKARREELSYISTALSNLGLTVRERQELITANKKGLDFNDESKVINLTNMLVVGAEND